MKYSIAACILIAAIIFSCNNSHPGFTVNIFNTDSLPTQQYSIDTKKDTLLQTRGGAWLKIDKGSLSAASGDKVTLEIKEAYSITGIIKAGLVTASNGRPLSSGGMIYINAAAGQKVTINKPIRVATPASYLDKSMQLYKGATTGSAGKINWTEPAPMYESRQLTAIEKGALLFQQKCASCHGIGKEGSGPDLANYSLRYPLRPNAGEGGYNGYSHAFYKQSPANTEAVDSVWSIPSKKDGHVESAFVDYYECNLINLFGGKAVDLSYDFYANRKDWLDIYKYIENESAQKDLPFPQHAYLDACADSCRLYKKLKEETTGRIFDASAKIEKLLKGNGNMVDEIKNDQFFSNDTITPAPPPYELKVSPAEFGASYYQFTIESFGWFNVDVLASNTSETEASELFVRITGSYTQKVQVYLIIPSLKVNAAGGLTGRSKNEYAFYTVDGKINLPQNKTAYILAVTELEESIAYALKAFTVSKQQSFDLSPETSSKDAFNKAVGQIEANGLNVKVAEAKNAGAIRAMKKTISELEASVENIEKLKPTGCDCDCTNGVIGPNNK